MAEYYAYRHQRERAGRVDPAKAIPSWVRYAPDDSFAEIYYSRPDAVWPDPDEPELPWAWYMADWLHSPAETAAAGYMQFERPWPAFAANAAGIEADKRWNLFPLAAMEYVARATRLFKVPEEKRSDEAKAFMTEILEGLEP